MTHRADKALAKALLKGDEREFERFFNEYFPRVYRFALTRLEGDSDVAQDVAQSALVGAMRGINTYRGDASLFSWLCQICRNEISGHYRRLSRDVPTVAADDDALLPFLEKLEADANDDPDVAHERQELKQLVQDVLDRLPASYGDALEWKYIHGYSVVEISERMQLSQLAVQSLLSRARSAFRDALGSVSQQYVGR
ncbi:MAG: RNA polymerase sigma factor [Congregibacter sp.]|nr:RNA polymerase sigma factor [Congregibacter sp.]MDP5071265.1 RNA polymerase sigma factor [Congregibacter sp.]